jgi:hypothetical protein
MAVPPSDQFVGTANMVETLALPPFLHFGGEGTPTNPYKSGDGGNST